MVTVVAVAVVVVVVVVGLVPGGVGQSSPYKSKLNTIFRKVWFST